MPVRRTQRPEEAHELGFTRLYRDDLEKIAKTLQEAGQLSIKVDDLEADEPADFSHEDMPLRPRRVTMTAGSATGDELVRVELGRRVAKLVLTEPTTMTEGVRARIENVCDGNFADTMLAGRAFNIGMTCVGVVALGSLALMPLVGETWAGGVGVGIVLGGGWLVDRLFGRRHGEIIVINDWRRNRPSFFRRTRDDWIVEAIMMILGLVIGYFIGRGAA